jgi:hypothetical protein
MMNRQLTLTLALALGICASVAQASVVSGELTGGSAKTKGGQFVFIDASTPIHVGKNVLDSSNLYAVDEKQNQTLLTNLNIAGGPLIAAGTRVSSHLVVFDPKTAQRAIGFVTFSAKILGVIITKAGWDSTNALFGAQNVMYFTHKNVGLEKGDSFSFAGNTLNIDFRANNPGDHVRVITTATVPLPASAPLLLAALAGLHALRRKRKTA